jgi:hypothetical protein
MRRLIMVWVVGMASAAHAEGAPQRFDFSPPSWPRDADAEAQAKAFAGSAPATAPTDMFVYRSATNDAFVAYYNTLVGISSDNPRAVLSNFSEGAMHGAAESATPIGAPLKSEANNALTIAQSFRLPDRQMDLRVVSLFDRAGTLHAAVALCTHATTDASAPCTAALQSLENRWPLEDRMSLDAVATPRRSTAYRTGELVGRLAVIGAGIAALGYFLRRRKST